MERRREDEARPDVPPPPDPSDERLAEVRRRLEAGELDTELALVETALAILDGDRPPL